MTDITPTTPTQSIGAGPLILSVGVPPGSTLGRFNIRRLLGQGGEAAVYEALDSLLARRVALKVYRGTDESRGTRLLRGARLAAQLTHPNIVTTYDFFRDHDAWVIVQELLDGLDLERAVASDPIRQLEILRDIAAGMATSHEKGIVHCDLKPKNVFMCSSGQIKILDFGLAADVSAGSTATIPLGGVGLGGTLHYLSPERLRGGPPSRAADVWAYGVLGFRLAAGRHPFETSQGLIGLAQAIDAGSVPQLIDAPASYQWQQQPTLLAELSALLSHCLRRSPGERHAFHQLQVALLSLIPSPVVKAPPSPATSPP